MNRELGKNVDRERKKEREGATFSLLFFQYKAEYMYTITKKLISHTLTNLPTPKLVVIQLSSLKN